MNAREEDFPTLNEYNDYLEMVEEIIFKLTNNIDVEATKKQVEQYKKVLKIGLTKSINLNLTRGRHATESTIIVIYSVATHITNEWLYSFL